MFYWIMEELAFRELKLIYNLLWVKYILIVFSEINLVPRKLSDTWLYNFSCLYNWVEKGKQWNLMLRAIENLLFCIHNLFRSCTFRQDNALNNSCICNRTPNHDTWIRSSDTQRLNCTQLKCTIAPETAKCEFMFLTVITKRTLH